MTIPAIPQNLQTTGQQVSTYSNKLSAVQSGDARIKERIIEETLPDSLFNVEDPTTGEVNFEKTEDQIDSIVDDFLSKVKISQIPALPSLSLIPKIPAVVIPSPVEIYEVARKKIAERKQQRQLQTVNAQIKLAKAEETPFTKRENMLTREAIRVPEGINNGRI